MDKCEVVLCGANAYEQKYYFNEQFAGTPESIKEELHATFADKLVFIFGTEWYDKQELIACNVDNSPAIW